MEKEYLLENSSRKKKFKWKRNNVVIRGGGRGTINESSTISYFSKLSHNKTTLKTRRRKNGDKQIGGLNPRPYILEFRATSPITPPSPGIHLYLANATQKQKPNSNLFVSFFFFWEGGRGFLRERSRKRKCVFFGFERCLNWYIPLSPSHEKAKDTFAGQKKALPTYENTEKTRLAKNMKIPHPTHPTLPFGKTNHTRFSQAIRQKILWSCRYHYGDVTTSNNAYALWCLIVVRSSKLREETVLKYFAFTLSHVIALSQWTNRSQGG